MLVLCGVVAVVLWGKFKAPVDQAPVAKPVEQDTDLSRQATLEEAVRIAEAGLDTMERTLLDYQGRLVKRERVNGTLMPENEMEFKIRPRRGGEDEDDFQPMNVYLRFVRPESADGREVIWREGWNDGKLYAHEAGMLGVLSVSLDPTGFLAMQGNRYPITQIGFKNLVRQLLDRADKLSRSGGAQVTMIEDYLVGDVPCLLIQVEPKLDDGQAETLGIDFALAEIAIDQERQIPLRYAAYGKPLIPDDPLPLEEEYTYFDVRLNVGLTDEDFDPENEAYAFP